MRDSTQSTVRRLKRTVQSLFKIPRVQFLLEGQFKAEDKIQVDLDNDGEFVFTNHHAAAYCDLGAR